MDMDKRMEKEWKEALYAGEQALKSLYAAREELRRARNWGIFDIVGGGFFVSMLKHSKINRASSYMEAARNDLQAFEGELRDLALQSELKIEIGDFFTFADFFFDGFIADFMVQSKIADAAQQVERAVFEVQNVMSRLRGISL